MRNRIEELVGTEDTVLEPVTFTGVLVMMEVEGRQVLLVRLGEDGSIHRMGTGSIDWVERDRYIGTTTPEAFRRVRERITPELLEWCGTPRSHPAPRGERCDLVIAFKQPDGQEHLMMWEYGSLSKWPPAEVLDFVEAVLGETRPWYESQKKLLRRRTQRAEFGWWQSFTVPHA